MSADQREKIIDLLLEKTVQGRIEWRYRPDIEGIPKRWIGAAFGLYTASVHTESGTLSVQLRQQPSLLGGESLLSIRNIETDSEFEVEAETETLKYKLQNLARAVKQQRKHAPDDIVKVLEEA